MSFDRAFTLKIFIVSSDGYQLNEFVQFNEKYYCFIWWLPITNLFKITKNFIVSSDGYLLNEFVRFNKKFYCFIWWLSIFVLGGFRLRFLWRFIPLSLYMASSVLLSEWAQKTCQDSFQRVYQRFRAFESCYGSE
jgi:hypothetical protein